MLNTLLTITRTFSRREYIFSFSLIIVSLLFSFSELLSTIFVSSFFSNIFGVGGRYNSDTTKGFFDPSFFSPVALLLLISITYIVKILYLWALQALTKTLSNKFVSFHFIGMLNKPLIGSDLTPGFVVSIFQQSGTVCGGVIQQIPLLISSVFTSVFILLYAVLAEPGLLGISLLALVIIYYLILRVSKKHIAGVSTRISTTLSSISNITKYVIDNPEFVSSLPTQSNITKFFQDNEDSCRAAVATSSLWSQTPRVVIELVVLLGLGTFSLIGYSADNLLTLIVVFFKIGPSLQSVFSSITTIRSNRELVQAFDRLTNQGSTHPTITRSRSIGNLSVIHGGVSRSNRQNDLELLLRSKSLKDSTVLQLTPKTIISLTGPSGSGKSTLLRSLAKSGLPGSDLASGQTRIIGTRTPYAVQYVSQFPSFFDGTILDNLQISFTNKHNLSNDTILKIFYAAALDDFITPQDLCRIYLNSSGGGLSGGQLQRLSLARSLVLTPRVLLLDETLSGVSSSLSLKILRNIKESFDSSIIIVSHRKSDHSMSDAEIIIE